MLIVKKSISLLGFSGEKFFLFRVNIIIGLVLKSFSHLKSTIKGEKLLTLSWCGFKILKVLKRAVSGYGMSARHLFILRQNLVVEVPQFWEGCARLLFQQTQLYFINSDETKISNDFFPTRIISYNGEMK